MKGEYYDSFKCPYCGEDMKITQAKCGKCKITIEGEFELNKINRLTPEQLDFAITFLINRGNLKELEKIYDLSYPTLRNRLNAIASILSGSNIQDEEDVKDTLDKLNSGEITFDDALKTIKSKNKE